MAPARRRPWLAIGLLAAGLVVLLVSFIPLLATNDPEDFPVVGVPGKRSIELTAGHTYTLNFEYPGARDGSRTPPSVRVTGPTGEDEPQVPVRDVVTYETTTDRRQGRAFATIHPAVSGVYVVEVDDVARTAPDEQLQVTVGRPDSDALILAWVASAALGLVLIVAGVVMLVVRGVRHRRTLTVAGTGRIDSPSPSPSPSPPPAAGPGWEAPDPVARVED